MGKQNGLSAILAGSQLSKRMRESLLVRAQQQADPEAWLRKYLDGHTMLVTVDARPRVAEFEVPLAAEANGYCVEHVEIRWNSDEREFFNRLFHGLAKTGATLKSGRYVSTPTDTIRWMLQQIKESV